MSKAKRSSAALLVLEPPVDPDRGSRNSVIGIEMSNGRTQSAFATSWRKRARCFVGDQPSSRNRGATARQTPNKLNAIPTSQGEARRQTDSPWRRIHISAARASYAKAPARERACRLQRRRLRQRVDFNDRNARAVIYPAHDGGVGSAVRRQRRDYRGFEIVARRDGGIDDRLLVR